MVREVVFSQASDDGIRVGSFLEEAYSSILKLISLEVLVCLGL